MDKQEAVEDNDPYSILSIFEIERITENTIEELPDQCKSIFKLSRINGLKNQEIADKLDISVRTVETQIYRALKILKSRLKDYLVSWKNNFSIYNRLLLNILYVINQKYGLNL